MNEKKSQVDLRPVIGINTLFIVPGRNRGVQTYLDRLLEKLTESGKYRLKVFVSKCNASHYAKVSNAEMIVCPVSGRNRVSRVLYEQFLLQGLAKKNCCNLMFYPGYLAPMVKRIPFVVTVPDTQFLDLETGLGLFFRSLYGFVVPRAARMAERVITISEFSGSRILHHLKIPSSKVSVIPLATKPASASEGAVLLDGEEMMVKKLLDDYRPYLISVSSSFAHKNIDALVKSFGEMNEEGLFRLILVGVERADPDPNVISTGFVSDSARDLLYQGARGYVFASRYEGFGIPLLEAMSMGLPIASSTGGSLPEVGGDACLYFCPDDLIEMRNAMKRILTDDSLRLELRRRGYDRIKDFSWEKTATLTEDVFAEVLRSIGPAQA